MINEYMYGKIIQASNFPRYDFSSECMLLLWFGSLRRLNARCIYVTRRSDGIEHATEKVVSRDRLCIFAKFILQTSTKGALQPEGCQASSTSKLVIPKMVAQRPKSSHSSRFPVYHSTKLGTQQSE